MPNFRIPLTNKERRIATISFTIGYSLSSAVAIAAIWKATKDQRRTIKGINSIATMLNDFATFCNQKPVEMAGEDFLQQAIERLNFISIASKQLLSGGKDEQP